ncbi:MAG: hypothetical protein DWQ01_13285 [Planctomycetota bacterium]|nr:MAG: hypothetical protein DWQ01_13285 [Planctomycetota bacterium]
MSSAQLREVIPGGKADQFVASNDSQVREAEAREGTFFLELQGELPFGQEQLCVGDLLAVSTEADAEPGDLVVWWTGSPESQALARIEADLSLRPVEGFAVPDESGQSLRGLSLRGTSLRGISLRGVVVGRLRRLTP